MIKGDIDINVKMRLIGYYMSEDQFMRTESVFPEKAEKLAELFFFFLMIMIWTIIWIC